MHVEGGTSPPNDPGASHAPPRAPLELLEADELLALGLRSSAAGDAASALSFFKQAVACHPGNAYAHWMLGAEYAALQLPERAHEHLARAVALEPAQPVARFQLGLLRLTRGDVEGAEEAWRALDARQAQDPLRRSVRGLLALARGGLAEARRDLQAAAADPATVPALCRDLEAVLACIGADAATPDRPMGDGEPTPLQPSVERHLALSAYAGDARP